MSELKWEVVHQWGKTSDRLTYRATLFDLSYGLEKVPTGAFEFVAWLSSALESIPAEYRDGTVLNLYSDDCDECLSSRAKFLLYVDREETNQEYEDRMLAAKVKREREAAQRASTAERKAKEKEEHDRAEFERLKKKYEGLAS